MSTKQTSLERFLTKGKRLRKETEEPLTSKKQKAFNRLYHEFYLKYGFIATNDSHIPILLCIVCCYGLSNETMKPLKLFCHLNTKQPGLKTSLGVF